MAEEQHIFGKREVVFRPFARGVFFMMMSWAPEFFKRFRVAIDVDRVVEIEVGDRFFQVGMGLTVWTVDRLFHTETCDIPHAVITRSGSCPDSKILSANTLGDTSLYRRDRREPNAINESRKTRRHQDPPLRSNS